MKITRRQLKRIIKEEKANLLKEQPSSGAVKSADEWYELLSNTFMTHTGGGALPTEELYELILALNMMAADLQDELDHPEEY